MGKDHDAVLNFYKIGCVLIVASSSFPYTTSAQTEIHKCTGADGGIVYSQLPCVAQAPAKPEKTNPDSPELKEEAAPPIPAERELTVAETPTEKPKSEADRATCKKGYRDAIDLIDAEIGREYSPEKDEQYKQRLLELTRGLRQC